MNRKEGSFRIAVAMFFAALFVLALGVTARTNFSVAETINGVLVVDELVGPSDADLVIWGDASRNIALKVDAGYKVQIDGDFEFASGETIIFADANTVDIGTSALPAKTVYSTDLDLADDLVVDDDALVTGTLTVTEAVAANGSITLAANKDLVMATTSDIGSSGTPGQALYMADGDFSDDLVVDDDALVTGALTVTESSTFTAGVRIVAAAAPYSSASTPVGEIWMADGTACGATDNEMYYFNDTAWIAFEDGASVSCW